MQYPRSLARKLGPREKLVAVGGTVGGKIGTSRTHARVHVPRADILSA